MALPDEDFNIEDEDDYETSESEHHNTNILKELDDSDDESNESTQSEIGSDESTQSELGSDNESDSNSDSDSSNSNEPNQLTEEQIQQIGKQKQMSKAEQDLKNMHKKLRSMIEAKLSTKRQKASKKYGNKSKEADDEYLLQCEADMNENINDGIIDVLQEQPSLINLETGVMRSYQLHGLNWLIRVQETGLSAILADEMGLGKTLQCIALLAYNKEYKRIGGPHLIVVPKSTVYNWQKEFESWCPCFRILLLDGDKLERKNLLDRYVNSVLDQSNLEFDVCITSYEQCNIESEHLQKIKWFYIVVDEAHRMKNENAVFSHTMRSYQSLHRLLITGTPLQNNLHELWALLNFLIPEAFDNADSFDILYEAQQNHKNNVNDQFTEQTLKLINNMLAEMHNLLRPLMLRRLKYDVEKSLPPKTEMILYVGLSNLQIALYKSLLSNNIGVLKDTIKSKKALLNTAMQLRKVCNHPYLFENVEDRSLPIHGRHVIDNAAKLCMLDKLLPKFMEQGSKCLVFCQMTRMLDILDDYCFIRGYKRCRIDGNTLGHDRQSQMDDFNREGSDKFIFLLSTRAGGLGINLVAADVVIFYDSDWNPQMDLQAQDRAHRIGQTKPVKIFRLVTKNTIEEKILQRAQLKLNLDELVIQKLNTNSNGALKRNTVSKSAVCSMIKYGIEEIIKMDTNDSLKAMNEMSIDEILNKGKEASSKLNALMAKHAKNRFSIKSTDYSLLEDCKLDASVFRTLAKIKKQNKFKNIGSNANDYSKSKGGRTTNNSSNGYIKIDPSLLGNDFDQTIKALNSKTNMDKILKSQRINDLDIPDKMPKMEYFQFFNSELLTPLCEKQWNFYNKYRNTEQESLENIEHSQRGGLNEYEYKLKQKLMNESFGDWNYKHLWAFVKCCAEYGRENIDMICKALPMKDRDDIIRYSKVFFENAKNHKEIKKKIRDIQNGESQIERYVKYNQLLLKKVKTCKYPMQEMEFTAPYDNRAHGWRVEHDRFIVCKAAEVGYGEWSQMRDAVLESPRFRFDYFAKSRVANDINKRMRQLRPSIEKELREHIRIFDRNASEEDIQKRKERQADRHKSHLMFLKNECEKLKKEESVSVSVSVKKEESVNRKRSVSNLGISDGSEPVMKRQKLNADGMDNKIIEEFPTPPPVMMGMNGQAYITSIQPINSGMPAFHGYYAPMPNQQFQVAPSVYHQNDQMQPQIYRPKQ